MKHKAGGCPEALTGDRSKDLHHLLEFVLVSRHESYRFRHFERFRLTSNVRQPPNTFFRAETCG